MTYSDWMHVLAALVTVLLLIAAGVSDVRRYRIPNAYVYAIVAAFAVGAVFGLTWSAIGWSVLAGFGMFALGAGLFAFGLFGGGDVKLVAAMALWTGLIDLPRFLLVMTAAGGLLGVVWMIKRRRPLAIAGGAAAAPDAPASGTSASSDAVAPAHISAAPDPGVRPMAKAQNRIPYGVAIAVAGLDFFVTSARSPFAPLWPWPQ